MATRKKAARRSSRKSARRTAKASRSMNDILIDLGQQYLSEGVREVLEEHGVDSDVKVNLLLTRPKTARKASRKTARKAVKRRR